MHADFCDSRLTGQIKTSWGEKKLALVFTFTAKSEDFLPL